MLAFTTTLPVLAGRTRPALSTLKSGQPRHVSMRRSRVTVTACENAASASTGTEAEPASPTTSAANAGPVFVAGATGRTGQRVCRLLTEAGIPVLAGCRSESKLDLLGLPSELATFVSYNAESEQTPDFGAATAVVCCLGAAEVFSLTAPGRIDGFGSARLLRAAAAAPSVKHISMVSSIGVGNPLAFPAGILNLFGGVLLWKDYAERALRAAAKENGKSYFIVRPGGLERAKDDFGDTHNIKLYPAGSQGGGVISRLQIAQLIVEVIKNPQIAENKTVEATAETTAPKRELPELIAEAPQDK